MLKLKLICRYIFYPLCLKSHALVIAVYADAKVIWSDGMMEADVSPIASEWVDALLQEVGCQVSALIMQWGCLREDGRKEVVRSVYRRYSLLHWHLQHNKCTTSYDLEYLTLSRSLFVLEEILS